MAEVAEMTVFECPQCLELFDEWFAAASCCGIQELIAYICQECFWLYRNENDARECCEGEG